MIKRYKIEEMIGNALEELNGKLSKPDENNKRTVFEANTDNPQNGEIFFSFKEDVFDNEEEPQRFRIRIEYTDKEMGQEDIKKYQMEHPVYYPRPLSLDTKCPVGYDWFKCSSKEHEMCCRTCANYNPLRMLYEKKLKPGIYLGVPLQVLLDDAKIMLDHKE